MPRRPNVGRPRCAPHQARSMVIRSTTQTLRRTRKRRPPARHLAAARFGRFASDAPASARVPSPHRQQSCDQSPSSKVSRGPHRSRGEGGGPMRSRAARTRPAGADHPRVARTPSRCLSSLSGRRSQQSRDRREAGDLPQDGGMAHDPGSGALRHPAAALEWGAP